MRAVGVHASVHGGWQAWQEFNVLGTCCCCVLVGAGTSGSSAQPGSAEGSIEAIHYASLSGLLSCANCVPSLYSLSVQVTQKCETPQSAPQLPAGTAALAAQRCRAATAPLPHCQGAPAAP